MNNYNEIVHFSILKCVLFLFVILNRYSFDWVDFDA